MREAVSLRPGDYFWLQTRNGRTGAKVLLSQIVTESDLAPPGVHVSDRKVIALDIKTGWMVEPIDLPGIRINTVRVYFAPGDKIEPVDFIKRRRKWRNGNG